MEAKKLHWREILATVFSFGKAEMSNFMVFNPYPANVENIVNS
jgi:hypothetical protein